MLIIFQLFTPQFSIHTLDLSLNLAENAPLILFHDKTFAWFTSSDEVTNKLSAHADFDVVANETFTPETTWTPGEQVDKDVYATNTGSTAAFVRTWLDGQFDVTKVTKATSYAATPAATDVKLGSNDPNNTTLNGNTMKAAALAAEAGGYLVYSPLDRDTASTGAVAKLATRNAAVDADTSGFVKIDTKPASSTTDDTVGKICDTAGYYIFARKQVASSGAVTYTYDGYYYDKTNDAYYRIAVDTSGTQLTTYGKSGANDIKVTPLLFNKATTTIDTSANTVTATYASGVLTYTYNGGTTQGANATDDDIIIKVGLANVDEGDGKWTAVDASTSNPKTQTYYYNNALYGGESTSNLVDYVELGDAVKNDAYYDLDFYLNVHVESIQAMEGDDKANTSVASGWAANDATKSNGATGTKVNNANTLTNPGVAKNVDVTWAYKAPSV